MVARRVNMHYSAKETVEFVLNEGSDLEDFSDSGSEENTVDSGKEFVPVDTEVDSSDSDNNIFLSPLGSMQHVECFVIVFFTVFGPFLLCCCDRERYMTTLWIIYLKSTHPKLSKKWMFILLFLVVYFLQPFLNG